MLKCLPLFCATVVLSGCLQSSALVTVTPAGSGTIEMTMLVNPSAAKGLLAGMGMADPSAAKNDTPSTLMNEADFKRAAERMGVRPVSLTPIKDGPFEGAKAIYAFDDISKIRVDQDPQMSGSTSGRFSAPPTVSSPIRFNFARQGTTSVLTVSVDEKATAAATEQAQQAPSLDAIDPAVMQMIKTMFDGFRIRIDLAVDGKIIETNADYVDGSRVTLVDVDLGAVLADPAALKNLQSQIRPGASLSELRPHLQNVQGVKINHPTVTIEFR